MLTIADMPPDSGYSAKRQQLGPHGAYAGAHPGYPAHQLPMPLGGGGHPSAYGQQPPTYYAPPGYEQYQAYGQPPQAYYPPPPSGYAPPATPSPHAHAHAAGAPPTSAGEAPPGVLEQLVSKDQAGRLIGTGSATSSPSPTPGPTRSPPLALGPTPSSPSPSPGPNPVREPNPNPFP